MLTVTIVQFVQEIGMEWNLMNASAMIAIPAAIIVTVFAEKCVVSGLRIGVEQTSDRGGVAE